MEKTIIALSGTANIGKTKTLKVLSDCLLEESKVIIMNEFEGHRIIVKVNGVSVGLQTFGDTSELVQKGLELFLENDCEIILIASKGYGGTVNAIERFSELNAYRLIWGKPFWVDNIEISWETMNDYSAEVYKKMVMDVLSNKL